MHFASSNGSDEEQYRTFFEASGDGIIILDAEGRIVDVNPAMCRMHGYDREELVATHLLQLVHPNCHLLVAESLARVREGETFRSQWADQRKDGSSLPVEVHLSRVVYRGIPHVLATARDVTGRVESDRRLERTARERAEALSTRMRELEGLYRADEILHRSLHLDQVLQALVDVVTEILQADKCAVSVWDEERQRLVVRATSGFGPDSVPQMVYAPGEGVNGRVFQTGEPLAVDDYDSWDGRIPDFDRGLTKSVIGVPLRIGGRVFGVFGVNYRHQHSFGDDEVRLFQALAQRAAIAIENARLYEQAQQAAALEERQRLARDLHDSVTQSLYGLTLLAEAGRRHAGMGDLGRTQHHLESLGETARQALKEMRLLVYELRPMELEAAGLASALQQRLESVERRSGVETRLLMEGELTLSVEMEDALYRVVQEALNNALKHARATSVTVSVRTDRDSVEVTVSDNGRGFDPAAVHLRGGFGLVGMSERAERLGGSLAVESAPNTGTTVRLSVPTEPVPHLISPPLVGKS